MKWGFVLLSFILIDSIHAQDTSNKKTGNIYFKPFAGWQQDGVRLKKQEFKQEIYRVPAAIPYFKKGNTNLILSYCLLGRAGSILLLINPQNTAIALTGFTLFTGGIVTTFLSVMNFRKAARVYNESLVY